jgi:hydrogenase nickel incorporation protein HypA/HybF
MHELGIARNIVSIVSEHARGARVKRVTLEIGQLSAILPDSIRFCFDVCSRNTVLEGAELTISIVGGRGRCRVCSHEMTLDQPFGRCICGSRQVQCIAGEELNIHEMELA